MIYWLHLIATALATVIPRAAAYRLVEWLTEPSLVFYRRHRRNALRNMRRQIGRSAQVQDAERLADRAFVNYGKYMVDLLRLPRLTPGQLRARVCGEEIAETRLGAQTPAHARRPPENRRER